MKRLWMSLCLVVLTLAASAQWSSPAADVPAYNAAPPVKGTAVPPILNPDQLPPEYTHYAWQKKAYLLAAKIPADLYQQPCYCHCDRALGHNSLHSCFEGTHGAACSTCAREAFYTYKMHTQGKTAKQIREGIERGDWQQIDLEKEAM